MLIENEENIDNVIIPQRFIPFDIGTRITEKYLSAIKEYAQNSNFSFLEISGLMKTISQDVLLIIRINDSIKL